MTQFIGAPIIVRSWEFTAVCGSYHEMTVRLMMQKIPGDMQGFADRIAVALNSDEVKKVITTQIETELQRVINL